MINIYVNLIINGRKTIEEVPENIKQEVIAELRKRGNYDSV